MLTIKSLNIYQRINEVMKEVSYVAKSDKKVNNMFRFVTHDSVVAVLRGPLVKHGIVIVPSAVELTQDGNRTVAKMEISFINIDDPADRFSVFYTGFGIDTQDKGPGKAYSYSYKYALLKVFALETGDDVEKDSIEYVPASAAKEEDVHSQINELVECFPPEDMKLATTYIENWKTQLQASRGSKWAESFVQGVKKSIQSKDKFVKAVMDWHSKQEVAK